MIWYLLVVCRRCQDLLVRDQLGIKPLFYAQVGPVLYLASEVKALIAAGVPAAWDEASVFQALHMAFDAGRSALAQRSPQCLHRVPSPPANDRDARQNRGAFRSFTPQTTCRTRKQRSYMREGPPSTTPKTKQLSR